MIHGSTNFYTRRSYDPGREICNVEYPVIADIAESGLWQVTLSHFSEKRAVTEAGSY